MKWVVENILTNEFVIGWFGAIGTIGAACVSLWIALREDKRIGKISVSGIIEPVSLINNYESIEVISCGIYNYSKFPITISSIKINVFMSTNLKKKMIGSCILTPDDELKSLSKLPIKVDPFENRTWVYGKKYFDNYMKRRITPLLKDDTKDIIIIFYAVDTFGKMYKDRIKIKDKELKKYLPD